VANKTALDIIIEKLYNRLKEEPEKGVVVLTAVSGKYSPTLEGFMGIIKKKMNDANLFPPEENFSWAYKISVIKKSYGIGPSVTFGNEKNRDYEKKNIGNKQLWWQREKAHLSADGKYYIVPLVFENMTKNPNLVNYKDGLNKYNIGYPASKKGAPGVGLLGNEEFVNNCKFWALKKLEKDLDKTIRKDQIKNWSKDFGFIPQNRKVKRSNDPVTGKPKEVSTTQSWHIVPRLPEYQTLWIKVMFDRGWVDSLSQNAPNIDYSVTNREVLILVKDLKQNLENLENILLHFDAQMNIAFAREGVEVNFDAKCAAGSISQIYQILDGLMRTNGHPSLEELKDTTPLSALQFGFTKDYILQYVSFSEVADCLCEEGADLTPYILKEGLNAIKGNGPFALPGINNFIHLLPEINRRYARYLKDGGNYSTDLFSMEQSWLDFVHTYIYPPPEVHYSGQGGSMPGTPLDILQLKNPIFKDLLFTGKYIKDPLQLMSPDVKNMVVGASNVTNMYAGDDNLLKALSGEVKSMTALFDKLLNRIPISELIKIAATLLFKCVKNSDMKRHLCQTILKKVPIAEIRQQLYPCLRNLGAPGEMAIAKLEGKITGRVGELYKIASARYPKKFPPDPATPWTEIQVVSKLTSAYCSDPYMQKKFGRAPDDFNEELAKWADDQASDAICDCVLTLYGPVTRLLDEFQDISDEMIDGMTTAAKDKLYDSDQDGTLALDRMINPIKKYLKSEDKMKGFKDAFANGLKDMGMNLVFATTMVVLKYVKDEFSGNLTKDLCNGTDSPFGFASPKDWIMDSQVYKDKGEQELWDKFKDLKEKHFFNQDIQTLVDGFEKLGDAFSPRELKRLFTTECNDSSFDGNYEEPALILMGDEVSMTILQQFPGLSLAAIVAQTGYDPTKENQTYKKEDPDSGAIVELPFPIGFISPTQAHAFLFDLGKLIDPDTYDAVIDEYDALQSAFSSLCDPINVENLGESIAPDDIIALVEGDQQQVLDDLSAILPLMDKQMMEDLYPPLFCGPCSPNQVGMKPMMPNQSDPTQLFMQERLNNRTYKTIDDVFNNNLSAYKPLIKEVMSGDAVNILINQLSNVEVDPEDPSAAYKSAVNTMLAASVDAYESDTDSEGKKLVAKKFRNMIAEITTSDNGGMNQLIKYEPENKIAIFEYDIPNTPYIIYMVFNFSGNPMGFKGTSIESPQIKVLCFNGDIKDYEYPPPEKSKKDEEEGEIFDMNDFENGLFKYWFKSPSIPTGKVLPEMMFMTAVTGDNPASIFKGIFPIASNLILETVWNNTSKNKLFEAKNFNSLPLTNQETESKCIDTDATPLLNPDKNKLDVDDIRKSLECVVSMFATPDALQIANLFGLYKMLIKVCIVEEFLKNIFMFSFANISDIIEDEAYMGIVKKNVKSSVESVLSTGYGPLLEYSEKIVNARRLTLDVDAMVDENGAPLDDVAKAEELKVKTPEESLDILIMEEALEVDSLMDSRIRYHTNPNWKDEFITLGEGEYFKNDFFKYAIHNEIMNKAMYPSRPKTLGDPNSLEKNKMPFFELIDKNEGWQIDGQKPFPSDLEGGLFFEPYVRMKSKLATTYNEPSSLEDAEPYFYSFWGKFKEAFALWESAIFRAYDDVNAYGMTYGAAPGITLQDVPHNQSVETGEPIINTFFTRDGGNPLYKNIFPLPGHSPTGAQSYGQPGVQVPNYEEVVRKIHNFIRKVIGKVEEEYEAHGLLIFDAPIAVKGGKLSTFWDFFLTFFSPVDKDGALWSWASDLNKPSDTSSIYKLIFQSTVSSLDTITQAFQEGITGGAGPAAFYNAFYYWQHYPNGVIPEARSNFRNRGVINFDSMGYYNFSEIADASFSKWNGSIIDIFSGAKETNIGVNDADVGAVATKNISNSFNKNYLLAIAQFMDRHGFDDFSALPDGITVESLAPDTVFGDSFVNLNIDYLCGIYEWLKRVVVEAPFDHWFDISLGMRLNLVVPYQGQDIDSDYIENLISELRDVEPYLPDIKIDRDYILDKTFLLSDPANQVRRWLCLPLEATEYDLRKYWEDVHKNLHPAGSPTTFGSDSVSSAFIDSPTPPLKENPWSLIMGKISDLGLEQGALEYNFSRGPSINNKANLYNNLFCPIKINVAYMQENKEPSTYYVNTASNNNPVRPTLWAACKLLNTSLAPHNRTTDDAESSPNPLREEIVHTLQNKIMEKTKGSKLLEEVLPIRQTVFSTALLYRYAMISAYPELQNLFFPTKLLINSFITQSIKILEGDYSYVNDAVEDVPQEEKLAMSAPSSQDVAAQFFELVVQMAANTVDPTWKTPWFFPGPLTPVGIIAKMISQIPDKDKDKLTEEEEECEDGTPQTDSG